MPDHKLVVISAHHGTPSYPDTPPFYPHKRYPELNDKVPVNKEWNITYELFRYLMRDLGFDAENSNKQYWNPFGDIIKPGQKVLIKPNLVRHLHLGGGDYQAVVTHGSLVRCVLDYVALALNGDREIVVGYAPLQSADFDKIIERTGLSYVCEDVKKTWGIPVRLVDFRLWSVKLDEKHRIMQGKHLDGDLSGYLAVDLGKDSLLAPLGKQHQRFRVTNYDCGDMQKHHNELKNEYLIPKTVLDVDVVINLPKLKTHRKVGLTAALKNLVGINGHKDWLPHHRCGSLMEGGDEYKYPSSVKRLVTKLVEKVDHNPHSRLNWIYQEGAILAQRLNRFTGDNLYEEGSWYGNDTLWRTVLDLNRLLIYADRKGRMADEPQRLCLSIVDGIVAGEGEGPMEPSARKCGILVGGFNPVAIDAAIATIIGFDYRKIPLITNGFKIKNWSLFDFKPEDIKISSNDNRFNQLKAGEPYSQFCFQPPSGWAGYIESEDGE